MSSKIPYLEIGGGGTSLVFAHANGLPPGCYKTMLHDLAHDHRVLAIEQRPLWPNSSPDGFRSWDILGDDLIRFLEENNLQDVVGVGHSMGGVATIIAASRRPELFRQIVLIDPVLFNDRLYWFNELLPIWLRKKVVPIAKIALKRKDQWPSKQVAYESLRSKSIFKLIPDAIFQEFIDGCIRENKDGTASLIYTKQWEAQVFCTPTSVWRRLAGLPVPTLAIKADGTNLLHPPIWEKWQRVQPRAQFEIVENTSHLLPLERPQEIVARVRRFLATHQ